MSFFGLPELIIILVIVLLLFGGSRLPKLSRTLGESMREVRDGFYNAESKPKSSTKATENQDDSPEAKKTTSDSQSSQQPAGDNHGG